MIDSSSQGDLHEQEPSFSGLMLEQPVSDVTALLY